MMRSIVVSLTLVVTVAACGGGAVSPGAGVAATGLPSSSTAPTPSAAASASIEATTPVPDVLRNVWIGPARDIAALGGPLAVTIMRIKGIRPVLDVIVGGQGAEALSSTVSVPAPTQVRFTSLDTTGGCSVGDEGTYGWSTSADGARLTMTEVDEDCAPRAEAVIGDWVRAACKDFGCLGELEAGTHQTAFFEPTGDPSAFTGSWRMQYGQVSYTVPDGWANAIDDPNYYDIVPHEEYAKVATDKTFYSGIALLGGEAVAAQDDACSPSGEPGVGQGADKIAARIALIPSLDVGAATSISIGGRSGTMLDVALTPGWSRFCATDGGVPVLRQGGEATDGQAGWDRRMTEGERWRLILLDVADGGTTAIIIGGSSVPSRFDELVAQAMPIVTSFEFQTPPS